MHPLSVSGFAGCFVLAVAGCCCLAAAPVVVATMNTMNKSPRRARGENRMNLILPANPDDRLCLSAQPHLVGTAASRRSRHVSTATTFTAGSGAFLHHALRTFNC
jgi:hypothetical protein